MKDPSKPADRIMVLARIKGPLTIRPSRLYFGRIFHGRRKTIVVTITKTDGKGLELSLPEKHDKRLSFELKETDPGREWQLLATLSPVTGDRGIRGSFEIGTNEASLPRLALEYVAMAQAR